MNSNTISHLPKVEVHTIRFGAEWWLGYFPPTLDAWCARHGHALRIWGKGDIDPSYPAEKFCEVDMLREFLRGDADWILYVDADVYVDADAPRDPGFGSTRGFLIRPDIGPADPRPFVRWCRNHFGEESAGPASRWCYRNAGVWACDRAAAAAMLEVIAPPYHKGVQEQHHWNWWLIQAVANGMALGDLPAGWNQWWHEDGKAAFYHVCGRRKHVKVKGMKARGLLPANPHTGWVWKSSFDPDKYAFTRENTLMEMDEPHVHMLHACLHVETPRMPGGKVVVEVGCYRGASTSALLAGVDSGVIGHLHLVEVMPTDTLRRAISLCLYPERVTLHTEPYWKLEIVKPDLVFVDGNHKWPALADVLHAITSGAFLIAMHDARSWPEFPDCWGAKMGADAVMQMADRCFVLDAEIRHGLHTRRGFMVSAPASVDLAPVREIMDSIQRSS